MYLPAHCSTQNNDLKMSGTNDDCSVQRLGGDGYKLFSEVPGEIMPPASIRAGGCSTCRYISSAEGSSMNTDSTLESIPSQPEASPSLSPKEPFRFEFLAS